jgi:D-methionine transport system permease protein
VNLAAGEDFSTPWGKVPDLLLPAYGQTWVMVGVTMVLVLLIGTPVGITLHNTSTFGLYPNQRVFAVLNTIVNVGRSLPFLILMASIMPFTRLLTGTNIGVPAAVVPMAIAGTAFFTRIVENSLRSVPLAYTRVARAAGASRLQIVRTAQLAEAVPSILGGLTINTIAMIEYSAIAGTIGAGGIGYVAVTYGYQRFDTTVMGVTIVILVVTVASVQLIGDALVRLTTPYQRERRRRTPRPLPADELVNA